MRVAPASSASMKSSRNAESLDVGSERHPPDAEHDLSHGDHSLGLTAERATVELCGNERDGRRCILARNHQGLHECLTASAYHCWT
jgi:hypothetical protein